MGVRTGRSRTRLAGVVIGLLGLTVLVFVVLRIGEDAANLAADVVPAEGEFGRRYALHPWLAYLHILPGLIYLVGGPVQLTARIRDRHVGLHRAVGRWVVLPAGVLTGVFAIVVGIVIPFGGLAETSASVVFGTWFLVALTTAFLAVRAGNVPRHRQFMIRAYAVGLAVGLIRIVVGIGGAAGIGIDRSFGAAFWIAFVVMAAGAEWWLRTDRGQPSGSHALPAAGRPPPR